MTPSLNRLTQSILTNLVSLLKIIISKTLDYLSMDSLFFADEDVSFLNVPKNNIQIQIDDRLYLVHYRWWNEARERLLGAEINGVLYEAKASVCCDGDDELATQVGLEMRRDCQGECVSGYEYALVSEWMFLRALKWHSDVKDIGSLLAAEDNMQDLFSLQIRLSFLGKTNSLVVKISRKDNEVGAFDRACNIFCVESGLVHIWDFSGQTTQFFLTDRKLSNDSGQEEEILLELQVYELSNFIKGRNGRKDEMTAGQIKIEGSFSSGSLKMNGSADNVNSYRKVNTPFDSSYSKSCVLGLAGLYNLGNTCFMNSSIQCLVHTPKIVDYFLGDFRKDLNFGNPLGMNGKLALAFGDLLRKLWAPGSTAVAPELFKSTLSGFAPQFSGYNQHDSQEILAFLLDGLHEDLNRVKCKPYIEVKDPDGLPDKEVADEHWQNHLARNDSIIVDMFQGQYRSTLVCPVCKKLSVTFDPFMCLSLPLPSTTMRTMTLMVLSTDGTTLPFPVTVTVPKFGRCKDLIQALSTSCSLGESEYLLLAEIYNYNILHFLDKPYDSIELIRDDDRLVAYRLPKDIDTSPLVVFVHQQLEESYIYDTPSLKKFGIPLVARISDFSKGSDIRKKFLKLLDPFLMPVQDDYDDDAQNTPQEDTEMEEVVVDTNSELEDDSQVGDDFQFYILEERGLLSESTKIQMNEPVPISGVPKTINVLVTWSDKMTNLYDTSLLSLLPEICKPASFTFTKKPQEHVSLYKCLEAFLKEEPLGPEDMWYCPNCKKHRQACKKLDLWRLPEILVIHLKRFSYNRFFKNKLETFVDFPIEKFDLSTYIVYNNSQVSHRYMLYAVSNHYGGMGGGHYTAFVQHGDHRWYEFDDSHVFPVSEEQIKTSAAYVLFYRKI